jgi:hypothetical protein
MVKKLLAMVLGVTMLIGATGCSAVDTGSGTGTSDTKSDTQVSVNADLLDATQYKSDKEAADWTIAVVVKDGTSGLSVCRSESMSLVRQRRLMLFRKDQLMQMQLHRFSWWKI